jgi:hypothetical protein
MLRWFSIQKGIGFTHIKKARIESYPRPEVLRKPTNN